MIQINKHTRHKLYWIDYTNSMKSIVDDTLNEAKLEVLDLGYEFALYIKDINEAQVKNMAPEYLSDIIEGRLNVDKSTGLPYVIIKNFGIMMENFLNIDVEKYLRDLSKNTGVVLLWEGTIKDRHIFIWSDTDDYSLIFKDTNIQKIDI